MDLIEMLNTHNERDGLHIKNYESGFCRSCDNPISEYGRTKIYCEYHWLKRKYSKIKGNCVGGGQYRNPKYRRPYLEGIRCQMTWKDFIIWASKNAEYKNLKDPALTRINFSKHYSTDNLKWVEFKEVSKFH